MDDDAAARQLIVQAHAHINLAKTQYVGGALAREKMAAGAGEQMLQFVPFVSRLDAGFWHELSRRKLEKYHLSEAAQYISGYYTNSEPTDCS